MGKSSILTLALTVLSLSLFAQGSWKNYFKKAEQLFNESKYAEAGDNYFEAWKLKQKKTELAFMAGECYYFVRDYNKAVKAYEPVKDMNDEFDLVGFKYAQSLKSLGKYEDASREFVYFINNYKADNNVDMTTLVQNAILGCEMALEDSSSESELKHIGENVNSNAMEYAPMPFDEDIIYYSSDLDGSSKVYRSQRIEGKWSRGVKTEKIFDKVEKQHYGNVSFAPDKSRFYFTQCDNTNTTASRCEIYMVKQEGGGDWSDPIRLPDYVNEAESTATHPSVVHLNGIEFIYFSSDRKGGKGGMDLWYISRNLDSNTPDFTFPKNLGSRINTPGNEMTPFYDAENKMLHFSSDGHITYGGFDIFSSEGHQFDWSKPKNLGKPFNSSADDRYYIYENSPENGFLVSNRSVGLSKLTTTHEDIFIFEKEFETLKVYGKTVDEKGKSVSDVKITLYEVAGSGRKNIVARKTGVDKYDFPLVENKEYIIEATKSGYITYMFEFPSDASSIKQDLILEKRVGSTTSSSTTMTEPVKPSVPSVSSKPKPSKTTTYPSASTSSNSATYPSNSSTTTTTYPSSTTTNTSTYPSSSSTTPSTSTTSYPSTNTTTYPSSSTTTKPPVTDPYWYPNHNNSNTTSSNQSSTSSSSYPSTSSSSSYVDGTVYKVQIMAISENKYSRERFNKYEYLGAIEAEYIPGKTLIRVLVGTFYDKQSAIDARNKVRDMGHRAHCVKYINGTRKGMVYKNE